ILNKYNLLAESNLLQLYAHADELSTMLPDWKACKDVKKALSQYCAKTKDVWDIWLHVLDLVVPKNNIDEAIMTASSHISQFHKELTEARVGSKQIYIYAKLPEVTRASNEIQKRQLEQRLPNLPKTPKHFFLEERLRRIQNINTTKIPTMQDLADIIIMLSMKLAKVVTLCIIHYEPGELNPPEWYKSGKAKNNPEPWQFLFMKKNPERAKELLIWIQDAIATGKLCNSVYSINRKCSIGVFSKFLKLYNIIAKRLRKIGDKNASRVQGGQNPTSQYLEFLSRIAMRHKIDCFDSGKYYAKGDTSNSDLNSDPELEPETQAFISKSTSEITFITEIEDIYDLYRSI
ncbi:12113_t:CDS:2, partial [Cetraspora pellucida]